MPPLLDRQPRRRAFSQAPRSPRNAAGGAAIIGLTVILVSACAPRPPEEPYPTRLPAADRVVAIGDLHGDLEAARRALRLAGAIDARDRWVGGRLVVVQTGDILDRGDQEEAIMDLFDRLGDEARRAGGAVHVLNGNHELMNAYLDFRYVTEGGFADFEAKLPPAAPGEEPDSVLMAMDPAHRMRAAAFRPGGSAALRLAERNTMVIVGDNLFVHGGVLPEHVAMGLKPMNDTIRSWLRGESPQPEWIRGDLSPVWTRIYSSEPTLASCDTLVSVLDSLGVKRMVMGHSVQNAGITGFCGGRAWTIDVGLAARYGGPTEVLEIRGDAVLGLRLPR